MSGDLFSFKSAYLLAHDACPVIFDTGASVSVSPHAKDFVSWIHRTKGRNKLSGLSNNTEVAGVGIVEWTVKDDRGRSIISALAHITYPSATVRLLSPQQYFKEQNDGKMTVTSTGASFQFPTTKNVLTFHLIDGGPDLPMSYVHIADTSTPRALINSVVAEQNTNLTGPQKELLRWHFKLGHFNLQWLQSLTRVREGESEPVLPTRLPKRPRANFHCAPDVSSEKPTEDQREPSGTRRCQIRMARSWTDTFAQAIWSPSTSMSVIPEVDSRTRRARNVMKNAMVGVQFMSTAPVGLSVPFIRYPSMQQRPI